MIDHEIIGMAKRLLAGIERRDDPIAVPLMRRLGHRADYLAEEHTLRWFQQEFFIPSSIIDRGSLDAWRARGSPSTFERARSRVDELLQTYQPPVLAEGLPAELRRIATTTARTFGMEELPALAEVAPA